MTAAHGLLDVPIQLSSLGDTCRLYDDRYARYNSSRDAFRRSRVTPSTDPETGDPSEFDSMTILLNAWGCRLPNPRRSGTVLAAARHARMLAGLASWKHSHDRVPGAEENLLDSTRLEVATSAAEFAGAFDDLRAVRVADESTYRRSFSDVAASKSLYLASPSFCIPWDRAIKRRCRVGRGSGDAYVWFLQMARERLLELRAEHGAFELDLVEPGGYTPTAVEILNKYLFVASR